MSSSYAFSLVMFFSCILAFTSHSSTPLNIIDSCRSSNLDWATDRQSLADCAVGFGGNALGGRDGDVYVVTESSDDPIRPKPGTLRYGTMRAEPLWIVFEKDMVITFKKKLFVNSYKTIDGRGVKVEIAHGPCITIDRAHHVIVHGISIYDCKKGKSVGPVGTIREDSDGDAISVVASSNIWIDHCYLANSTDGLIDVTHGSTMMTISNNRFTQHKKVMLLGHKDGYTADRIMKITLAFNHFGPELGGRIPRVRYGYAHVANNFYEPWSEYAIGGSSDPTILSEGNYFIAPNDPRHKEVTKREVKSDKNDKRNWKLWRWTTLKDVFENGAYFVPGAGSGYPPYNQSQMFPVCEGSFVPSLTSEAGPLQCVASEAC